MTAKADSRRTPISEPESITEFRKFFVFSQATGDPEGIAKDMLDYIDVLQAALHTTRTQLVDADKTLETVRVAMGTSTVMEGLNVIDRLRDEIRAARKEASRTSAPASAWVSVGERLPEMSGWYFTMPHNDKYPRVSYFRSSLGYWDDSNVMGGPRYWMAIPPLPPAPGGDPANGAEGK